MARAGTEIPFVGRADELVELLRAVEAAAGGRPGAVLVTGDAGVGKTRLVGELARRAAGSGARVLLGHCIDLADAGVPYLPFAEALRPLVGTPDDHPVLARWLGGHGDDPGGDREVGQLRLFDAVLAALEPVGAGPTVLVVEDLHWADRSSRDLLAFLVRRLRRQRLLVVATVRTDDLHRRHPLRPLLAELTRLPVVDRVQVGPFTAAEMSQYVAAVTGSDADPAFVERLLVRSEGNPYFAEQLVGYGAGGAELPSALADVLLQQVDTLPVAARDVVRAAAAAGARVDHDLLAAASGRPAGDVDEALREAVARHVLVPSGDGYAFRHALAREAVYADLLPGERVRLHAAFARLLAERPGGGRAGELAHHRFASHDLPGSLTASVRAADEALALLAPAEALQHLERALQLWDAVEGAAVLTGRSRVELTLSAVTAASRAGSPGRAAALARDAVERADADGAVADRVAARRALAVALAATDRPAEALAAADEALDVHAGAVAAGADRPGTGDDARAGEASWAAAVAARALALLGRLTEAQARASTALERARHDGRADIEADLLITLAAARAVEAGQDAARPLLERALRLAREAGVLGVEMRAAYNLAVTTYESGDVRGAAGAVDAAVARAEETGLSWSEYGLELRVLQVIVRYATGDLEGSRRLAELAGRRPSEAVLARITAVALLAAVARGDDDAAATVARLEGAWQHDGQIAMVAGGAGAELQSWRGDPAAALETVNRAIAHVARVWEPWFVGGIWLSAVGLAAAGDLAEHARLVSDAAGERRAQAAGRRLLERAHQTARHGRPRVGRMGPEGLAWLRRADAEWTRVSGRPDPGQWDAAIEAFRAAVRGVDGYEEARCRWRLAEALLAVGDRDGAAAQAGRAAAAAQRLGARPLLDAVSALVARGRLDAVDPSLPRARVASSPLTPRELQVLALLAEGLTNREAGRRLYVTEKTVSVHVSNLLAKLGARSRTEAVTVAHRRGLLAGVEPVRPPSSARR